MAQRRFGIAQLPQRHETRQELEKLLDAKVFIEIWVKVRSGWADDEARVRSFGYE